MRLATRVVLICTMVSGPAAAAVTYDLNLVANSCGRSISFSRVSK